MKNLIQIFMLKRPKLLTVMSLIVLFFNNLYGNDVLLKSSWDSFAAQQISAEMTAENNHRWQSGFTLEGNQDRILVSINIKLIPAQGVKALKLEQQKKLWLEGIQDTWNNKFSLRISEELSLPIVVQAKFTPINPHHEVLVRNGRGRVDQNNWFLGTPSKVVTHEVGHMLGAYDEYPHGAVSSHTSKIDRDSLMGSNTVEGRPEVRNLDFLLESIQKLTGLERLTIVQSE